MSLTLLAPAKLNLTLDILGRRGGYHELDSVMVAVDLCDTLTMTRAERVGLRLSCSDPTLPADETNLVMRAARVFFAQTGIKPGGLEFTLTKRIPEQAGLAGGSADAAATLVGLNELYGAGLTLHQLIEIGITVGSDVPFCLMGGCVRDGNRGVRLKSLPSLPDEAVFVIAKPPDGISTRRAFELYDQCKYKPYPRTTVRMVSALHDGNLSAIGNAFSNAFEQAIPVPDTDAIKRIMLVNGALGAAMTGSGSAAFGLFADEALAAACLEQLRTQADFACIARPVAHGPKIV